MRKRTIHKAAAALTALALCAGVLTGCGGAPARQDLLPAARFPARRLTNWPQRTLQT